MRRIIHTSMAIVAVAIVWIYWIGPQREAGRKDQQAAGALPGFVGQTSNWVGRTTGVHLAHTDRAGVLQLAELQLQRLQLLQLIDCELLDEDLEILSRLGQLVELNLQGTPITDAGLKHLVPMRQLRRVRLRDTQVTFEGLKWLEKERPNLQIKD